MKLLEHLIWSRWTIIGPKTSKLSKGEWDSQISRLYFSNLDKELFLWDNMHHASLPKTILGFVIDKLYPLH